MAMNRHFCIFLLALLLIAAPAIASNNYDHSPIYESKYAEPDLDANELQSLSSGALYISLTTAGCLDADARTATIAAYEGDYFNEIVIGPNGKTDLRLEPGQYLVRIAKGAGSSNDLNTWKAEEQTVTITAGGKAEANFIGAGGRCGLSVAEPAKEDPGCPVVVSAVFDKRSTRWVYVTLNNPAPYPQWALVKTTFTWDHCVPGTRCKHYTATLGSWNYVLPGEETFPVFFSYYWQDFRKNEQVTATVAKCKSVVCG